MGKHKDYYNTFDRVIVLDIAPLLYFLHERDWYKFGKINKK